MPLHPFLIPATARRRQPVMLFAGLVWALAVTVTVLAVAIHIVM